MRQFSTLFKQTQTLMNTQSSFFYMANFFISRFRSSSFTQHGPRQQQQHRPQPVSTKMIAMAISIGAQLKKKEMSQIKKLQLKTPDLCFPQALNVLRIRRDSLKFKHNIPPRPNDLLKPRPGVCTALFDRWERIVQFYTGRGLRAHLLLSFYPLIKVLQLEHSQSKFRLRYKEGQPGGE